MFNNIKVKATGGVTVEDGILSILSPFEVIIQPGQSQLMYMDEVSFSKEVLFENNTSKANSLINIEYHGVVSKCYDHAVNIVNDGIYPHTIKVNDPILDVNLSKFDKIILL
jgi:hypothetical protein